MRVSRNWLNEYVDVTSIDDKALAEKMTLVGNEYASIEKISDSSNLVVGYVLAKEKHPNSDHLNVCKVDLGDGIETQIVCGAPNVDAGQKVIVAKIGAKLPGNIEIKQVDIRGITSNGMICALEELGIESKYVPEASKGGIHVLKEDAPLGMDALEYLCYNDTVTDYELTANRGDLMSMLGMAYEVGAILKKDVKLPENNIKEIDEETSKYIEISTSTDNVPTYLSRIVKDIVIKDSPNFIKARLMASGIRPINNVVDISNYVMLEYGQPLHFFDYDKLGNKVIVRMASSNETMITLDGTERTLKESDIVITTPNEVVALAGVMGNLSTEVTNDTKTVMIESAIFNPTNIRITSKAILRSEASSRFEKGVDVNRTYEALNRAAYLIQEYASGKVLRGIVGYNNISREDKIVYITLNKIVNVLGMKVTKEDVVDVLDRLKFKYQANDDTFTIYVPTRRLDVNIEEDIIEEVGRIHGYDNMLGILPITSIKSGNIGSKNAFIKQVKERVEALGLNETITYSLGSENNTYKFTNQVFESVSLLAPMSEERKTLRYSLMPSLLSVIDYNLARNQKDIMIYEIGSSYCKKDNEYLEKTKLAIAMLGTYSQNSWQCNGFKVDFYLIKGVLENILNYLGFNNRYMIKKSDNGIKELHPNISADILIDDELVGYIGCVHPNIHKLPIYIMEISMDKLFKIKVGKIKAKQVSLYPSINKDVAFILDRNIESSVLINTTKQAGGRTLTSIDVFDVYTGNNIDETKKSIALSLTFMDINKTLTDDEVNALLNNIIKEVETKLGGTIRTK